MIQKMIFARILIYDLFCLVNRFLGHFLMFFINFYYKKNSLDSNVAKESKSGMLSF